MPAVGDDTVDDNPTQKMMQQDGQYVLTHKGAVKKRCCECKLGGGASGGVWLRQHDNGKIMANGVHIVSDGFDFYIMIPILYQSNYTSGRAQLRLQNFIVTLASSLIQV